MRENRVRTKRGGAPWKQRWSLGPQEVFSKGWCLDGVSWVQREDGKMPRGQALWLLNDKVQQALEAPELNIRRGWENIRDRRILLHLCCSCPPLAVHLWPWLGTEWWARKVLIWSDCGHLVTSLVAFRSKTQPLNDGSQGSPLAEVLPLQRTKIIAFS